MNFHNSKKKTSELIVHYKSFLVHSKVILNFVKRIVNDDDDNADNDKVENNNNDLESQKRCINI